MENQLGPYKDILQKAREKRFREWEPKLRYLAEQFNSGKLKLPKDPEFRQSLFAMKESNHGIIMNTIDSNVRMLANALWDAKMQSKTSSPHLRKGALE